MADFVLNFVTITTGVGRGTAENHLLGARISAIFTIQAEL